MNSGDRILISLLIVCGILWIFIGWFYYGSLGISIFSAVFSLISILLMASEDDKHSVEEHVLNMYKKNTDLHNKYMKVLDDYEHALSREIKIQQALNIFLEGADVEAVDAINEEIKDQGMEIRKDLSGKWVLFISGGE